MNAELRPASANRPHYRLRVFHRAWPWRATVADAEQDALASGNAFVDRELGGRLYLTSPATIERYPPNAARPTGVPARFD